MADRVGQQFGNYQLIRLLGEGSFAQVYLGEHIHLGTQGAIKVLHTQLASDDIDKFRNEARTIARLIHPHIVRVLEFGVESKTPFLVMDYAPNGTLRQRYPQNVTLPLATIVSYVKQIADALQYAHNERLIHRDIKPENMLLGQYNEILLSDFGIALVAQSSRYQSTQEVAGTMAYMAPEQIQGKPRPASDQYSLGIVVYEWISGNRPFYGSLAELVGQHLSVTPPSLQEKVPTIPPIIEQVLLKALAKDPKERFDSVQVFAAALEQACQIAPYPIAQSAETISPSHQSTPNHTDSAPSPNQLWEQTNDLTPPIQTIQPTNTVTSPRSQLSQSIIKAVHLEEPALASNSQGLETTAVLRSPEVDTAIISPHRSLHSSRILLLIGLVVLVIASTIGLYSFIEAKQIATNNVHTIAPTNTISHTAISTANAVVNATATENALGAHATATLQTLNNALDTIQNPYSPRSGTLVLNDPLKNNNKGYNWCNTLDPAEWKFPGDALHVITSGGSGPGSIPCIAGNTNFSNFAFQVQMTVTKGSGGGIIFYDGNNINILSNYRFDIRTDGTYTLSLEVSESNNFKVLKTGSTPLINFATSQTYLIGLVARGGNLDLYINLQHLMSVNDSTLTKGAIGVEALTDGTPSEVIFRNAKVWSL